MRTKFQLAGDMFQALCQIREFLRPAFHQWLKSADLILQLFQNVRFRFLLSLRLFIAFCRISAAVALLHVLHLFAYILIPNTSLSRNFLEKNAISVTSTSIPPALSCFILFLLSFVILF